VLGNVHAVTQQIAFIGRVVHRNVSTFANCLNGSLCQSINHCNMDPASDRHSQSAITQHINIVEPIDLTKPVVHRNVCTFGIRHNRSKRIGDAFNLTDAYTSSHSDALPHHLHQRDAGAGSDGGCGHGDGARHVARGRRLACAERAGGTGRDGLQRDAAGR
jgi:hypothetical protein